MTIRIRFAATCVVPLLGLAAAACSEAAKEPAAPAATTAAPASTTAPASASARTEVPPQAGDDAPIPATASPYDALPEAVRLSTFEAFTGLRCDGQTAGHSRRRCFNHHYFIDKGEERGITYESIKSFETDQQDLKTATHSPRGHAADVAR